MMQIKHSSANSQKKFNFWQFSLMLQSAIYYKVTQDAFFAPYMHLYIHTTPTNAAQNALAQT